LSSAKALLADTHFFKTRLVSNSQPGGSNGRSLYGWLGSKLINNSLSDLKKSPMKNFN
jgi:hypothetical protein